MKSEDAIMFTCAGIFIGVFLCFLYGAILYNFNKERAQRERRGFAVFRSLAGNYYVHDTMALPEFTNHLHECMADGLTKYEARKYCNELIRTKDE
jgi:hypothetical protein